MDDQFDDWTWQMRNRISTVEELSRSVRVSPAEEEGIRRAAQSFAWAITPYYASLMDPRDPDCPIRQQVVPSQKELHDDLGVPDPLDEGKHSPVDSVIRVYPDRIAFTVSKECPTYCRHCLRKERVVGEGGCSMSWEKIEEGIRYVRENPEIRDVLLTGGDPLMMSDERLERILSGLYEVPSVEVLRIGSRAPCTLPQRITPELCEMLQHYHPLYLNTQFNHPREITPEAQQACSRLAAAGIPLGNQTVLLHGINDDVQTQKKLVRELMRIRVRPYYLYQCQVLTGTRHFRTPIECGTEIIRNLQGWTSGLAVPKFVVDTPYGKIPAGPDYMVGRRGDRMVLRSFDGRRWEEPNPLPEGESEPEPQARTRCTECERCSVSNE